MKAIVESAKQRYRRGEITFEQFAAIWAWAMDND